MAFVKKTFKLHPVGIGILLLLIPMVACSKPEINPNPPTPAPEAPVIDWKTELQNIEPLFDKRELDASALPQAISQLQKLEKISPSNPDIYAQLARAQYFLGQYSSGREKKLYEFRQGMEYARKAIALDPNSAEGQLWYGVNLGSYHSTKGAMSSLNSVMKIVRTMEKVIALDPKIRQGAAYIVLGRVYHEAPGRPFSVGNIQKAIGYLEKAKQLDENYYETRFLLMEIYQEKGSTEQAKLEAEWLVKSDFDQTFPVSAKHIKKSAQELLDKYRNK